MPKRTPEQNARRRAEYALNRDKINAQRRASRNSERDSAYQRARYWADPGKAREQRRVWHAQNTEKEHVNRRARYTRDRDEILQAATLRRARARHGMHPEDWAALWTAQEGRCYLCSEELVEGKVHVDHDHSHCPRNRSCKVCRRGLSCNRCNQAIGLAADDPDRLERMAASLRAAKLAVAQRMTSCDEQMVLIGA